MKINLMLLALAAVVQVSSAGEIAVDFTKETGKLNPALHSSGWTPRAYPRSISDDDEAVRSMNLTYARTHDWALFNPGQRVVDYQYIFPLMNKDPKDPSNYCFGPTDHLLQLSRNVGLKTFYRLGTSIEHTGKIHFNAAVPEDFDKVAEVFAGIVRHYNKGWANGKNWNIEYWEIWNEPDGVTSMWCDPEDTREWGKDQAADTAYENARKKRLQASFVKFFVKCLKRLKSEFPEIKVGGPALCWLDQDYFRDIFKACKEAGVAPDFISWHYYGPYTNAMIYDGDRARKLCDEFGFTKTELIINEWHYILTWKGVHSRNATPEQIRRALDGPTGHNNIDSACHALTVLEKLQFSKIDQAYYYGCSHDSHWGYMDQYRVPNKIYYAMKLFGSIVRDYPTLCGLTTDDTLTAMGLKSKDGRKVSALVTDYRGTNQVIKVSVKGAERAKRVSAVVLDNTRDLCPVDVKWSNGELTFVKEDKNSAACFITFEL